MKCSLTLALLVLLAVLVADVQAMKASKLFKFPKSEQYVYLTKFSVGEGHKGQFNFRAGFSSPLEGDEFSRLFTFHYIVVNDEKWEQFMNTENGREKLRLANYNSYVTFKGDGFWSSVDTQDFYNKYRTTIMYIAAINGNQEFHTTQPWLPKVWMEVKAFNAGEHFSQEDWGLLSMNFYMLILFVGFLGYGSYRYFKEIKAEESWESPLGILVIALFFEFAHIGLNVFHYSVYEFDGEGIPTFDILGTICQVGSQIFIVTLLLLIAFGWTINYTNLPEKDTIIMFSVMSFVMHALIAGLTALDKDQYHKYHDYSGIQGLILVILRVILFIVFGIGINMSSQDIKQNKVGFLRIFTVSGSFYILAFPILYGISYLGDSYVRNRLIIFGHFVLQTFSCALLMYQLSVKDSKYKDAKAKYVIGG